MGKFRQFLTELSTRDTSIFLFQDNNFSKSERIFTKFELGMMGRLPRFVLKTITIILSAL